ncbi:hypothetical protein BJF90_00335 [Pseudonocardia sp. CNS-004]|nr:hypothetical protein BJF90_00335 [Pseudonocardia sp. CNS-004]
MGRDLSARPSRLIVEADVDLDHRDGTFTVIEDAYDVHVGQRVRFVADAAGDPAGPLPHVVPASP